MLTRLYTKFQAARNEEGATAIEYGLLAALIAVAIIATVITLGGTLDGVFESVDGGLAGTAP